MSLPTDDKQRKELQYWTFLTEYFLKAWMAVANVAIAGNRQHNPGEKLHWAREKSKDQMNTAFRHQLDYAMGVKKDTDGQYHLAKAIWRLSAQLQLDIEQDEKSINASQGISQGILGSNQFGNQGHSQSAHLTGTLG